MARVEPPEQVKIQVAVLSRRRCCLCAGLDNDWRQKKGQVAHVVAPSKVNVEDLAWLCLDHHSEFDSRTSQHRNIRPAEVLYWRDLLYQEIGPRLDRGIEFADEVAVTPFVLVMGSKTDPSQSTGEIRLRNYSAMPGLITEIVIYHHPGGSFIGRAKYPIAGNEAIQLILARGLPAEGPRTAPKPLDGVPSFEIEVCDLAEVVTRRRAGYVGRGLALANSSIIAIP